MFTCKCRLLVFSLAMCAFVPALSAPARGEQPLKLGVHPYLPATELVEKFTPLAKHLAQKTRRGVVIHISKDYQEHLEKAGRDEFDIAYMGPASYVSMVDAYGQKPLLARLEVAGKPEFRGMIIVQKDSPLKDLSELKGRKFVFGDPNSTMSYIVPRYMLFLAGIKLNQLKSYKSMSNHNNVALAVLAGDFDAGAVKEGAFNKYKDRGLRILALSPAISEHVFVASSKLSPALLKTIASALLALKGDPGGKKILASIKPTVTGMVPARDRDYDNLRIIIKTVKGLGAGN